MYFSGNPFFILNISCRAGRKEIMKAAEEQGFVLSEDICAEAQNNLLTPSRRLTGEVRWFISENDDQLVHIRECINNQRPVFSDALTGISKVNATIYNFSLGKQDDYFEIGYEILDLDIQYSSLDAEIVTAQINSCRTVAQISNTTQKEVFVEIGRLRGVVRQIISDRLAKLDQDSYVELVTMIAEKCISDEDYEDGVILSDIVDQYEIRMQATLEQSTTEIRTHIERIKQLAYSRVFVSDKNKDSVISERISELIERVKMWDKFAQPLQLRSQASGMPHEISEQLGFDLRSLAIYLHNEQGKTNEALTLVKAMQDVFAEMGNLSNAFEADSETLSDLSQREKGAKEILAELDFIKQTSESLKTSASSNSINSLIDRVRKLNARLKGIDLDEETKTKLRVNLCLMARDTAISLHNDKQQTDYAQTISKELLELFGDISFLKQKLTEDVNMLNQQRRYINMESTRNAKQEEEHRSKNAGCLAVILITMLIVIISVIANGVKSCSIASSSYGSSSPWGYATDSKTSDTSPFPKKSSSPTQAPSSTTATETRFTSSASSGDKVYADITSIFPKIGIYTQGSSNYSEFVCKCETSTGSIVWVYMSTYEYISYFDSDATTSIYDQYAEELSFLSSKRVHGTVKKAENIMAGLSSDTGTIVIDFGSVS